MLIPKEDILRELQKYNKTITGVLHIGAHECEETDVYRFWNIPDVNVIWIDALNDKVDEAKARGVPNVYCEAISDKDGEDITFKRTNNNQSSSILNLGAHANYYPHITVTESIPMKTKTIDTFMSEAAFDRSKYNFWNFDIQGAELKALMGGEESLKYADALYLEVNTEELYTGCALLPELDNYLNARGFRRIMTSMTNANWGDALYIRA